IDSDLAWDTIRVVNDPPKLFRCSGLVRIEHDDEGIPIVQRLDAPRLTHYLSQKIRWVIERQRAGTTVECAVPPPAKLVSDLPADRTHAVTIPLTAVARDLIEGPTPLFIFTKPAPGTGASLLCDVWTFLLTGRPPRPITQASDEEEWRKRITSLLIAAPTVNY